MTAELTVTEAGTRRFIKRWVPFCSSENAAVLFQSFDAKKLGWLCRINREWDIDFRNGIVM